MLFTLQLLSHLLRRPTLLSRILVGLVHLVVARGLLLRREEGRGRSGRDHPAQRPAVDLTVGANAQVAAARGRRAGRAGRCGRGVHAGGGRYQVGGVIAARVGAVGAPPGGGRGRGR